MDEFLHNALCALYDDKWTDDLLSSEFVHIHRVLAKREMMVLELKVQHYEDGIEEDEANTSIARLLRVKEGTIERVIYDIKHVFRHGLPRRVDNKMHPEIFRAKRKKERKKRNEYIRQNSQDGTLDSFRTDGREGTGSPESNLDFNPEDHGASD